MLTSHINFKPFKVKLKKKKIRQQLISLLNENNQIIKSLTKNYKYNFEKKKLQKY